MMLSVSAFFILAATGDEQFVCRSMQSGAKANLKALYVAEEAHRAEFDTYATDFTKLGFKPFGGNQRYSVEVKSATANTFTAEASASLNGRTDVWRINESNNLVNLVNGCGDASPTSTLVDGDYELIVEQMTFKPKNGQIDWDPGDAPDPLFILKSPVGQSFSPVTKNSYSVADIRIKTTISSDKEMRLEVWDSDAFSNDIAGVITFIPSELYPDADGRVSVRPQSGQLEGNVMLRFKPLKAAAPNSPWKAADSRDAPSIAKPLASFTLNGTYCHLYPRYVAISVSLPDAGGEQVVIYNDGSSEPAPSRCDSQSIKPKRLEPFFGVFAGIAGDAALLDEGTSNSRKLRVFELPGGRERITVPFDSSGEFTVLGNALLCPNAPLSPSDKRPAQPPKCRPRTAEQGEGFEEELRASKRIDLKSFTSSIEKVRCEYIFHE